MERAVRRRGGVGLSPSAIVIPAFAGMTIAVKTGSD